MKAIQLHHGMDGINSLQLIKAGLFEVIEAFERSGFGIVDKRVADFDLRVTDFPENPSTSHSRHDNRLRRPAAQCPPIAR